MDFALSFIITVMAGVVCHLICILIFMAVFALYGIDMRVIWYPLLLCAVVTVVFFLRGFFREREKH